MRKSGAIAILTTMFLGLMGWTSTTIIENRVQLSALEERERTNSELLKEVRDDVKTILEKL